MGNTLIMHIDDAPFRKGDVISGEGMPGRKAGNQVIGDEETGQHALVVCLEPDRVVPLHSHGADEVIYILEGELSVGKRVCNPGTVLFIEKDTQYGFTVGGQGVRFLNVRHAPAGTTFPG